MPVVQSILVLTVTALVVLAAVLTYIVLSLSGGAGVLANRIGQGRREAFVITPQRLLPARPTASSARPIGRRPLVPLAAFRDG